MLDKLLEILKKSGEDKIIALDRQTGEFYVLSKWEAYEKMLSNRSGKTQTPQHPAKAGATGQVITQKNAEKNISENPRDYPRESASMDGVSDEERFFMET